MMTTKLTKNNLSIPSITFETGTLTSDDKGILIWNDSPVGSGNDTSLETSNFDYLKPLTDGSFYDFTLNFSNEELSENQIMALSRLSHRFNIKNAIIRGSNDNKANLNFNFCFNNESYKIAEMFDSGHGPIGVDFNIYITFTDSTLENTIVCPFYFDYYWNHINFFNSTLSNCDLYANKCLLSEGLTTITMYIEDCTLTNCNIFIDKLFSEHFYEMLTNVSCNNTCTNVKVYDFDNNILFEL